MKGWKFLRFKDHCIPREERELEDSAFDHGVWNGFSKVLVLQVMTGFLVDLQSRA